MTRPYKRGPNCSHCDEPRAPGRAYCAVHWAGYQRNWKRARAREFKRLKAMVRNVSREILDEAWRDKAGKE